MKSTINHSSPEIHRVPSRETPPYVVFHIQTPAGRRYLVNGEGFVTRDSDEATRYPVTPEIRHFRLEGVPIGTRGVHCSAPLYITATSPDQVEVYWGNRRRLLCPDDLVVQAGRLVWAKLRHLHQGGYPFGPVVRIVTDEPEHQIAIFNIEIHPPPGQIGFLHPAPSDWDDTPRSIMTHLGLLGFSIADRQTTENSITIWRRPLDGTAGEVRLETGLGSRVERLTVEIPGQPSRTVGSISRTGGHNALHRKLISLITALESIGQPADLASLFSSLFQYSEQG
jgi:hypothetical protein